ncbi:MAG: NAD(P)/FAD-dependent oxidoreductase [Candidatus Eremiobacteraeota bacterium]|nr:NAD(P)/FAD-dependent oxidoreductase [Candidatus Eremiobacteraeota bacterium]
MIDSSVRRYVIVGNGFAGTTAAEQLRKHDSSCEIALFTDEPYMLYNRIALPPLLRKQVAEQKVIMRDLEWHKKNAIDLYLETRVERVNASEKTIEAAGKTYPYDALLVATGGRPNPHPALGSRAPNVYNFQYMSDTKAISAQLEDSTAAVAIGGSFIAYELAEAFVSRKVEAHWVLRGPHVLHRMLDEVAGEFVDRAAKADGVHMHYGEEVVEFVADNGAARKVRLKNGSEIEAQCFGVGLGLTLNTELLAGTDVQTSKNGILCDDRLETNVAGIFAAGDIADFQDPILEMRYRMGTWNNAGAHGKVVAKNMIGGDERYHDVPEYSSLLFKGQTITQFGLSPEYRSDIETASSFDREKQWYRGLYFLGGRLVGGIFLGKGNRSGKRKYVEAIKNKQDYPQSEWPAMLEWKHD